MIAFHVLLIIDSETGCSGIIHPYQLPFMYMFICGYICMNTYVKARMHAKQRFKAMFLISFDKKVTGLFETMEVYLAFKRSLLGVSLFSLPSLMCYVQINPHSHQYPEFKTLLSLFQILDLLKRTVTSAIY